MDVLDLVQAGLSGASVGDVIGLELVKVCDNHKELPKTFYFQFKKIEKADGKAK